jgi:hypothetical protein
VKILALISVADGADFSAIRQHLADELRGSWELFAAGILREAYATASPSRVVFTLETESIVQAQALLEELPLVKAGVFAIELMELRPFTNWSLLFAK